MWGVPRPRNLAGFDWSAEAAATKHGFSFSQIEDAFSDAHGIFLGTPRRDRDGTSYESDDRQLLLAKVPGNGPYLHILYVVKANKIKPFHAREMTDSERRLYQRKS